MGISVSLTSAPKFEKRIHHVVPQFWQEQFASPNGPGPYYKNVKSGKCLNSQGPGHKMAVNLANIVFDDRFRPSDALEDRLGSMETKIAIGLRRVVASSEFDEISRADVAMLLALQACRYPELYVGRLDIGKYFAIAVNDLRHCADANTFSQGLASLNMPINISPEEFERIQGASSEALESELDDLLARHGYEHDFNPGLIVDAALKVAEHICGLKWTLLVAGSPSFILSDHPVPERVNHGFSVGLSSSLGLMLTHPAGRSVDTVDIVSATSVQINHVNREVRSRSLEWICGPGNFVHQL